MAELARQAHILVVEDDPTLGRVLVEALMHYGGWSAESAIDGTEALRRVERRLPDLILTDDVMPLMGGHELLERLRAEPRTRAVPVMFMSGHSREESRLKALQAGACDYVLKPVAAREMVARIETQLDIAAQRSEREAELQGILDCALDAVVAMDQEARVLYWNPRAEQILGWTAEEARGRNLADQILQEEELAAFRAALSLFRTRGELPRLGRRFELLVRRRDGREVPLEVAPCIVRRGKQHRLTVFAADVTARREAEVERARLLADAEHARQQAEAANRMKDEFLATLSHELRTPLNAIVGWIHLLRTGELDEATRRRALDIIDRNARAQTQLIAEILDMSRIISGKLRLAMKPLGLASAVEAALETVRPAAEAKGVRLEPALERSAGMVYGDADRLQQVAWNLLANAVKFTERGGRVRVELFPQDGSVVLRVADDGAGIEPALLPHVFDRFRQGDSSPTRPQGGLGLGLAIVRHLVDVHGGVVHAESPGPGQGSTFTVRLPLAAPSTLPAAAEAAAGPPMEGEGPFLEGVRVLVVEDGVDARETAVKALAHQGATVLAARTPAEALELLQAERPHVLVSDVDMPGESSLGLIRRVRALAPENGGEVPAAALTGYLSPEHRMRLLLAGYQSHVPKPIRPEELVVVVATLAKRRGTAAATPEENAGREESA